jgi:hypothetical protein
MDRQPHSGEIAPTLALVRKIISTVMYLRGVNGSTIFLYDEKNIDSLVAHHQ